MHEVHIKAAKGGVRFVYIQANTAEEIRHLALDAVCVLRDIDAMDAPPADNGKSAEAAAGPTADGSAHPGADVSVDGSTTVASPSPSTSGDSAAAGPAVAAPTPAAS